MASCHFQRCEHPERHAAHPDPDHRHVRQVYAADTGNGAGGTEQGLKALEDVASIEVGLLAVPGVSDAKVVKYAQNVASTRKDCVYIADPPIGLKSYQTACWANGAGVFAGGSLISTSYSCTYSPWVKDVDGFGDIVYLPPSAVVIAKMMENNQTKNVWDACAGTDGGSLDILGLEYNMDKNDIRKQRW